MQGYGSGFETLFGVTGWQRRGKWGGSQHVRRQHRRVVTLKAVEVEVEVAGDSQLNTFREHGESEAGGQGQIPGFMICG